MGGYVIYHNESDLMFYSQSWAGFNAEVTLGGVASEVVERTDGLEAMATSMISTLTLVLPQGRLPLLLTNIAQSALHLDAHAEELERGIVNLYRSYGWINEEFPGLLWEMLVGSGKMAVEHAGVFDVGCDFPAGAWLKFALRSFGDIVVAKKGFGGVMSIFTGASAALKMVDIQIDSDAAKEAATSELEEALSQLGVESAVMWAAEILSRPLSTYQRLWTEIGLAAHAAGEVGDILEDVYYFR